jgi:hypothetical protein
MLLERAKGFEPLWLRHLRLSASGQGLCVGASQAWCEVSDDRAWGSRGTLQPRKFCCDGVAIWIDFVRAMFPKPLT